MSVSSDISNLFKQFGGCPEQYQEIARGEPPVVSTRRPPISRTGPAAAALPTASADVAHDPAAHPIAEPDDVSSVWVRGGLQRLLSRLSQERRRDPLPEQSSTIASRVRPALGHLQVIAVVSGKGGVGKSTLVANLAVALQRAGRRVVALDLDPQNALHHHFLPPQGEDFRDASLGVARLNDVFQDASMLTAAGVRLLPYGQVSEVRRQAFEHELAGDPLWLAEQLASLDLPEGTVVVIDTPPGPSLYLHQALAVANLALVVSLADAASYSALPQIDSLIKAYTAERETFHSVRYVINQVDSALPLSRDICVILNDLLGDQILGQVQRDQAISEALAYNRLVLDHDPKGRGCSDLLDCASGLVALLDSSVRTGQPV